MGNGIGRKEKREGKRKEEKKKGSEGKGIRQRYPSN
jgi:hypothetical protein